MDSRPNSKRDDPTAPTPAAELTATLWCLAVLLVVVLLAHWGIREIYSN
jgi:hypothetical protein